MNPLSAFTLDIPCDDKSKAKLHLNRTLLKRVLHENKFNTVGRNKARRKVCIPTASFTIIVTYFPCSLDEATPAPTEM